MPNCYRHPKVETLVRCGKCDRPICPNCMISGPAGMRCPDCASLRSTHLYQLHPARIALAAAASVIVGTIGATIIFYVGFFVFLLGPAYGAIVAEAVLRSTGRKRGPMVEVVGVGGIVAGAIIAIGGRYHVFFALAGAHPSLLIWLLWPLVGVALAISTCYSRLKYF